MSHEALNLLLVTTASVLNILLTYWISSRRVKPEIDKMRAEQVESYAEAAESTMQGAHISNTLLLERIAELKYGRRLVIYHNEMLMKQLIDHGIIPISPPDTGDLLKKE